MKCEIPISNHLSFRLRIPKQERNSCIAGLYTALFFQIRDAEDVFSGENGTKTRLSPVYFLVSRQIVTQSLSSVRIMAFLNNV